MDEPLLRDAVLDAVRHGSLVVAAQGQDRFGGSPQTFPADDAHVLTVVSTERDGTVYVDTNGSESNDLAAPGVKVEVAVPISASPSGYQTVTGTSYATALRVRGSSPWIWTERPALDPESALPVARPQREAARSRLQLGQWLRRAGRPGGPGRSDSTPGIRSSRTTTSTWCDPEACFRPPRRHSRTGSGTRRSSVAPWPRTRIRATCSASGSRPTEASARRPHRTLRRSRCEPGAPARTACSKGSHDSGEICLRSSGELRNHRMRVSNRSGQGRFAYLEVSIGSAQNSSYALALSTHSSQ